MQTTRVNVVVLSACMLLASADGTFAQRVRNANPPAAPAAAAPTVTGKIVAYEPEKTITLETTARNGVKRSEFTIGKGKTKIELVGDAKAIVIGLPVTVTPDNENPQVAARIVAGANNAPPQRGNPPNLLNGTLQGVDAAQNTVTVATSNRATGKTEKTYELAKDVVVLRDGKPAKVNDLKQGSRITVKLSPDQKTAVSLSETGKTMAAPLKSVDPENNTITLTVSEGRERVKKDVTHELAKDGKVTLEGKEVQLEELKDVRPGSTIQLTFSVDDEKKLVHIQYAPGRR